MDEEAIDAYFNNAQQLIEYNKTLLEGKESVEKLVEVLGEELKVSKENLKCAQEEIQMLLKTCDSFSTMNFIDLKENVAKLEAENKKLRTETDDLRKTFENEITNIKKLHAEEISLLTNEHQSEIQKVTDALHTTKEEGEKQTQQLYTDLQLFQAQAAMQRDVMEVAYVRQIRNLNDKFRDMNLIYTNLHTEKQNLMVQYNILLKDKEKYIFELENKLRNTENTLMESHYHQPNLKFSETKQTSEYERDAQLEAATTSSVHDKSKEPDTLKTVEGRSKIRTDAPTKYHPLEVTTSVSRSDDDFESFPAGHMNVPTRKTVPIVYVAKSEQVNQRNGTERASGNFLPPLKPCSDAKGDGVVSNRAPKKRKLFNPDDLDYLEQLDRPE